MKTAGLLVLPQVQFGGLLTVYSQASFSRLKEEQAFFREVVSCDKWFHLALSWGLVATFSHPLLSV